MGGLYEISRFTDHSQLLHKLIAYAILTELAQ